MYREELAKLSNQELIALVLAQASQIEELTRRIAELETKLGGPPKTPDNSSLPPSQGRKPNRAERRAANKRKGRPGVFRALAPNPDRIVASVAEHCPHCERALTPADQVGFHAYDHIELPLIRPVITRIHRHRGVCPGCRRGFSAPPPAGMSPGSPFGPDLIALILHLHVTQAIGFERLVCLLDEVLVSASARARLPTCWPAPGHRLRRPPRLPPQKFAAAREWARTRPQPPARGKNGGKGCWCLLPLSII